MCVAPILHFRSWRVQVYTQMMSSHQSLYIQLVCTRSSRGFLFDPLVTPHQRNGTHRAGNRETRDARHQEPVRARFPHRAAAGEIYVHTLQSKALHDRTIRKTKGSKESFVSKTGRTGQLTFRVAMLRLIVSLNLMMLSVRIDLLPTTLRLLKNGSKSNRHTNRKNRTKPPFN